MPIGLLLPQERSDRGELDFTLAGVNKLSSFDK
jgi:hypothetical protein